MVFAVEVMSLWLGIAIVLGVVVGTAFTRADAVAMGGATVPAPPHPLA